MSHVSYKFRRNASVAVRDVSLRADHGNIVGIQGENGVGKSTLLCLIGGLYVPDEGTIRLDDAPVDRHRRRIAWIAAEFDMFPYLSVEENIRFFLEFYRVNYGDEELEALLQRYRLGDDRSKPAYAASRGMRRKTQIVTALLQAPALLLADEPLDGLDEDAQELFLADITSLAARGGIALMVLHDQERASHAATRLFTLPSKHNAEVDAMEEEGRLP